jgi:hypothetical protein
VSDPLGSAAVVLDAAGAVTDRFFHQADRRRQGVRVGYAAPAPARETFGPLRSALACAVSPPAGTRSPWRPSRGAAPFSTSPSPG